MVTESKSNFLESLYADGIAESIEQFSSTQCKSFEELHGTHNYHPLPVMAVRAKGIRVWDDQGREYLDCIGAYSAVSHGHLNPFIMAAARQQLDRVTLVSRAMHSPELGVFLKALCEYTDLDMACPMNSGAEAVETCIKLARKWGYEVKNIPDDRAEIIVADGNFHGRTTTIVGFSSEEKYREHFGPFTPGFHSVPFGDISALERAVTSNTAAVMMEPIQAEGGVIVPPDGYLAQVRQLCNKHKVLLILDEIQTGFGRTGKRFAWQYEDAKPDLLAVGKALGGGIFPVSAAVGSREVMSQFKPGDHGSTFGGNPLACVIGLAAIAVMVHDHLDEAALRGEAILKGGFEKINSLKVKEVRGKGMLIGLEVEGNGESLTEAFLKQGILTKETRSNTFRFAPPLTSSAEELHEVVDRVTTALASV